MSAAVGLASGARPGAARVSAPGERIRVLHVIETLSLGGAERQLVNVVKSTTPLRTDHIVVTLGGAGQLVPELQRAGHVVHELGLQGRLSGIRATRPIATLIRQEDPDVVHTWLFHADIAGRLAQRGRERPALVTSVQAPNYEPTVRRQAGWSAINVTCRRLLDAATARLTPTCFVACSNSVARSCVRRLRLRESAVRVIYNSVENGGASTGPTDDRDAVRRELGIQPEAFVFATVGRMDPQKGHTYLLDAFASTANRLEDPVLLIVGSGVMRDTLERRVATLGIGGHTKFLGARLDVPRILEASDAFVFPSLFEGLPVAVLEAMEAGVPVIVSSIDPLLEVVEHEHSGLVVRVADPRSLAEAMVGLADDEGLRQRLAARAREEVRRRFSLAVTAQEWASLYRELAANSRSWYAPTA